jgi:hypothetical protein
MHEGVILVVANLDAVEDVVVVVANHGAVEDVVDVEDVE